MFTYKAFYNSMLVILSISGGSLWSQIVQATETIPVTMTGVIQAPAINKTGEKTGTAARKAQPATDTIPVTMTGVIQAPAAHKADVKNGVVIGGTRMIYDGNQKESTIAVRNQGKRQWLVQSWVDNDGIQGRNSSEPKPPFEVTPALFRLGSDGSSSLHIRQTRRNLPADRESVYWLNIKTVPDEPNKQANTLTMSVNQRLKIFYRPAGIKAPTEADYSQLTFSKDGENLRVSNPTPYYVTFYTLKAEGKYIQTNGEMVPPRGTASYKMIFGKTANKNQVNWQVIKDYGEESKIMKSLLQ